MNKQFSSACERNRQPILDVLKIELATCTRVLEIGSGTGQHAVFFAAQLPQLIWQTSDLAQNHPSIQAWMEEAKLPNVLPPIVLDMAQPVWPSEGFDAVFTANTCHIMAWPQVESMFAGAAHILPPGRKLCVYGPFNYAGKFTSPGNAQFDASLRAQAPHMGIRDIEAMQSLAHAQGFVMQADHAMPANNRLLVWQRS
jgi:cyclopropane fatty-acyl-phospholipid synthase-like methyltransferase